MLIKRISDNSLRARLKMQLYTINVSHLKCIRLLLPYIYIARTILIIITINYIICVAVRLVRGHELKFLCCWTCKYVVFLFQFLFILLLLIWLSFLFKGVNHLIDFIIKGTHLLCFFRGFVANLILVFQFLFGYSNAIHCFLVYKAIFGSPSLNELFRKATSAQLSQSSYSICIVWYMFIK